MKKIFTLCAAVLMAVSTFARVNASVGLVGGLGLGVQGKFMFTDNLGLWDELGYFINPNGVNGGYAGLINSTMFAFQMPITETSGMELDWYAGGQVKIGWCPMEDMDGLFHTGVFGVAAGGGIEAKMKNAPISVSFDFRPGWAMTFAGEGVGIMAHLFDYSFNLGARYKF